MLPEHPIAVIILMYCVATAVAIVSQRIRAPLTAALLVVGVAMGAMHIVELPRLTRDLLFTVFLPGLLFEAAYHLEIRELRESSWTISALAIPGVGVAILLTAAIFVYLSQLMPASLAHVSWSTALLFAGVIAATDPVAVTALFRQVNAPRRLHVLVESESLLNDGTSIVFLTLLISYVTGQRPTPQALVTGFVTIAGGGAIVGLVIGWFASHVRTRIDDAAIEITLTTIAAYGSFVAAESVHFSGVIATVTAGVICGHAGRHHTLSATTRSAVDAFWEWLAFALNSAVFLLLGAEIDPSALLRRWPLILVGAFAVLLARALVILAVTGALSRTSEHVPLRWRAVMTWGGLRGALSLVLALSLPDTIADRELIVELAAGTVALSLLFQGGTMPMLLRRLRVATG